MRALLPSSVLVSILAGVLLAGPMMAQGPSVSVGPDLAPLVPADAAPADVIPNFIEPAAKQPALPSVKKPPRFEWHSAVKQSAYFLAIQHGFRMLTEPGTRAELKGPFFKDWFASVRGYDGWGDGDPAVVNYIGHPMMGSVTGFIEIQNDRDGKPVTFGANRSYWHSRARAMLFAGAYSAMFELGPVSESSLGNVGLQSHTSGVVDLVVTPTVGMGWLLAEDIVDRYVIAKLERRIKNRPAKILLRGVLNPSRSFASLLAGQAPWIRYDRPGVWRRP
jgi:hypothetical protein